MLLNTNFPNKKFRKNIILLSGNVLRTFFLYLMAENNYKITIITNEFSFHIDVFDRLTGIKKFIKSVANKHTRQFYFNNPLNNFDVIAYC